MKNVTVTLYCEVHDEDALYTSALAQAIKEGMTEEMALEILTVERDDLESDGEVPRVANVAECVRMMLDPGSAPGEGFSIESSDTEETE